MNTDKMKPTPPPAHKREGARYETCRGCGLEWNVSKKAAIPRIGYSCPHCWSKFRNGEATKRSNT